MFRTTFSRERFIIGLVFSISFAFNIWLWYTPIPYTDAILWSKATQDFADGTWPGFSSPIPPHPGTSILLPAAVLTLLGIPVFDAMQITIVFLLSFCIALIAYLCRTLRPDSLWWLGTVVLLIPNPIYMTVTAPSALAALITGLYILLILYIREKGASRESIFWLGVCAGVLSATRIDAGASIVLFSLPFLWPVLGKRLFSAAVIAMLFFGALNPYLWQDPILYILTIIRQISANAVTPAGFEYTLVATVLPLIAAGIALIAAYWRPGLISVPTDFLKWLLATSALLCCIISLSDYHPIRYFFPIMTIWEILLPLFLVELITYFESFKALQPVRRSQYALIALLIIPRIISLYSVWVFSNGPIFYHIVENQDLPTQEYVR